MVEKNVSMDDVNFGITIKQSQNQDFQELKYKELENITESQKGDKDFFKTFKIDKYGDLENMFSDKFQDSVLNYFDKSITEDIEFMKKCVLESRINTFSDSVRPSLADVSERYYDSKGIYQYLSTSTFSDLVKLNNERDIYNKHPKCLAFALANSKVLKMEDVMDSKSFPDLDKMQNDMVFQKALVDELKVVISQSKGEILLETDEFGYFQSEAYDVGNLYRMAEFFVSDKDLRSECVQVFDDYRDKVVRNLLDSNYTNVNDVRGNSVSLHKANSYFIVCKLDLYEEILNHFAAHQPAQVIDCHLSR